MTKKDITEAIVVKYLDLLLISIDDITSFNSYSVIKDLVSANENIKLEHFLDFINELSPRVRSLAITYEYIETFRVFEPGPNERLTQKGINARRLGGHLTYETLKNKKSLDWYRIIPMILTLMFGSSTVYFAYQNSKTPDLLKQIDSLNSKIDSLSSTKSQK